MEQITLWDLCYENTEITKKIRLIELFGGIGSQAMALRDLGADFEHYRLVEFDEFAVRSYNAIHGTDFKTTDIRDISGTDLGIKEKDRYTYILTYSFPCQDLSLAGKRGGMEKDSGTRSSLLWEVERLLSETPELPDILLMENVSQVISDQNKASFRIWQDFLISKGYTNYVKILNAADYGIPQHRERCFMVSVQGEKNYKFPAEIELETDMNDWLDDETEEKYYIESKSAGELIEDLKNRGELERIAKTARQKRIIVAGSLAPEKEVQDRARVLSGGGICQCLRATDHKDPPKILEVQNAGS